MLSSHDINQTIVLMDCHCCRDAPIAGRTNGGVGHCPDRSVQNLPEIHVENRKRLTVFSKVKILPFGVSVRTPPSENGLCVQEGSSDTPTVALPPMSRYCRHGSFDRNDPQPLCAEFGLLLRLIRPHHQPLMTAVIHRAALERVGLIN